MMAGAGGLTAHAATSLLDYDLRIKPGNRLFNVGSHQRHESRPETEAGFFYTLGVDEIR